MENQLGIQDPWERTDSENDWSPVSGSCESDSYDDDCEGQATSPRYLYETYGTNEPYTKPTITDYHWSLELLSKYVCCNFQAVQRSR